MMTMMTMMMKFPVLVCAEKLETAKHTCQESGGELCKIFKF